MQHELSSPPTAGVPRVRALPGIVPGLLATALGGGIAVACAGFMGPETVLCVLIAALLAAPLVVRWWTGTFDLFEPAVVIASVYFVYFVFAPLVRFATDDMTFIGRDFQSTYLPGLVAVVVAVSAMWLGYALPVGPAPAHAAAALDAGLQVTTQRGQRLSRSLLALALVCMVLWARIAGRSLRTFLLPGLLPSTGTAEGGGTDIAYLFLSIEWFIPALTVLIACGGLRQGGRRVAAVLAVTLLYMSIGFRYRIVVLWLAVGMLTYLQAGRRPKVRNLLVPGMLAFLFAGWLAQARLFFRSGGAMGGLGFSLRDTLLAGLADTRIFETFGAVLSVIPRFVGHAGVTPLVYGFYLPIPRFIWTGKPMPYWLGDIASSIGTPDAAGAGVFVPHFGEFYVAFGWPGLAVGMFLFGIAAKWLWRWYRAAPADPWRQAIFVLHNALLFQVIIRGYLAQIVQEWCFIVLPAVVIAALARRRAQEQLPRAGPSDAVGRVAADA